MWRKRSVRPQRSQGLSITDKEAMRWFKLRYGGLTISNREHVRIGLTDNIEINVQQHQKKHAKPATLNPHNHHNKHRGLGGSNRTGLSSHNNNRGVSVGAGGRGTRGHNNHSSQAVLMERRRVEQKRKEERKKKEQEKKRRQQQQQRMQMQRNKKRW